MITSKLTRAAGVLCILYIAVQSFQWWVFASAPPPTDNPEPDFLFSAEPASVVRSYLMLFSMVGLFFIFFVLTFRRFYHNKAWSFLAFCGFSLFCLLEIILRSVELFYTQIHLPQEYVNSTDAAHKALLLSYVTQFQYVQWALYFPLGLSQAAGSFIMAGIYPVAPRYNYLIKGALYINGTRLVLRSITVYFGVQLFPTAYYEALYLPMVFVTFGMMAWWFFQSSAQPETPPAAD